MDVSCPRCKTEYEFDDARVPDSGVTVKCTSCNHVFRVRKKSAPTLTSSMPALVAPPPAAPPPGKVGDETIPARSPQAPQVTREWKVRQPSGNIFSFKELTTLQKWIVERKVSRDDEISLTGEAWKRLGNIAELASFFQIVDDAKKVHELEALQQMKDKLSTNPVAPPAPPPDDSSPRAASQSGTHPAPGERAGVLQMPPHEATPAPQPKPHEARTVPPDPPRSAAEDVRRKLTETLREPGFTTLPPKPPPEERPVYQPPPLPIQQRREILPDVEAETIRPPKKGGGAGMVIGLLLVLAGLGGAAGYYFVVMLPEQQRAAELKALEDKAKADAEARIKEEQARKDAERLEEEKKKAAAAAAAEAEKKRQEEEAAKAAAAVPDAGAAVAKKGSGSDGAATPDKPAPKRSADYWISQGDRLRDKERAEAALDAYGKALDINPENVEALTGQGLCFLDMAKPLQAEPVLEHALKLNPRYAPAIMGLAESFRFQGKKEKAIAMYQKYLDTFPNGPEAGVARANIDRLK